MLLSLLAGLTLAVLCAAIAVPEYRRAGWWSPLLLVSVWCLVFISGDAIYSAAVGDYGPGEKPRFAADDAIVAKAATLWTVFLGLCYVGYRFAPVKQTLQATRVVSLQEQGRSIWLVLLLASAVSLGVAAYVVAMAFAAGLNVWDIPRFRNRWFSNGGGILFAGLQLFQYALLLTLALTPPRDWVARRWFFPGLILVVLLSIFSGSRSNLVYGFGVPMFLLHVRSGPTLPLRRIVIFGALALLLVTAVYRPLARDQFFSAHSDENVGEIILANLKDFPRFFWGGYEASSLDGTIDIVSNSEAFSLELGATYLDGLTAPIPTTLWPGKPGGGGNAKYTMTLYPDYYGELGTEYSISMVGELYLNGGIVGVMMGGICLGAIVCAIVTILRLPGDAFRLTMLAIIIGRLFSLLRSDFFNFVAQLSIAIIATGIAASLYYLIGRKSRRSVTYRGGQ